MSALPHENSTRIMTNLARSFRVEVDTLDQDRWSAAFTVAKALDTIVDDDHIYNIGCYSEQLLRGERIPYTTSEEAAFVSSTFEQMSNESQELWRGSAAKLGSFALRRIDARTVTEYIDVTRDESTIMANVLLVENDTERTDHNGRHEFNNWMHTLTRAIYALDTFTDIVKDYNEGNVSIEVTPPVIGKLGMYAAKEAMNFARVTPIRAYPAFFHSIATKITEKARQPDTWMKHLAWKRARQY